VIDSPKPEEKLAHRVWEHITTLMGKRKAKDQALIIRLAVKFCGGCNPSFDRGKVIQILRQNLAGVRWVLAEEEADFLVLINGCLSSCADRPEVKRRVAASVTVRGNSIVDMILEEQRKISGNP